MCFYKNKWVLVPNDRWMCQDRILLRSLLCQDPKASGRFCHNFRIPGGEKIQKLNEKYQGMKKNVGRKSTKDEENFNNLLQEIKWTFDISDPKAREILKSDKKHSPEVIEEDLKFFEDYVGPIPTIKFMMKTWPEYS